MKSFWWSLPLGLIFWACLILLLTGCSDDNVTTNYGYGYEYDVVTDGGIRVRYAELDFITPEEIDKAFRLMQDCTSVHTDARPLVILSDARPIGTEYTVEGRAYFKTGTVVLYTADEHASYYINLVLRHEFVHFLGAVSGMPNKNNSSHQSSLFQCARVPSMAQ